MTARSAWITVGVIALVGCKGERAPEAAPPPAIEADAAAPVKPEAPHGLVTVDEKVTRTVTATRVVIVNADGAISHASITAPADGALEIATLPAGAPSSISELASAVPKTAEPCPPGPDGSTGWGTLGTGRYGTIGRIPAGLRGGVLLATTPDCNLPLVVIDAGARASRLVEVLSAMPDDAVIAVSADGGVHARTLTIRFRYTAGDEPPTPTLAEIAFTVRPDGIAGGVERGGAADPAEWAWTGDDDGLAVAFEQAQSAEPVLGKTEARLRVDGDVTAGALIGAIAKLLAAEVTGVAIGEPRFALTGGYGIGPRGPVRSGPVPLTRVGMPTLVGGGDKATIRRYIKRNAPKIKYCYEKELLAQPKLEGRVTAKFTIQPDGSVSESTATGVDDHVSTCVAAVIESIEFPKPKDGATVQVTYPFELKPTGG